MSTVAENNKRITKNTAILYGRMLLVMLISIYSSRVILDVLGIDDYGTYAVVGGFVGLLSSLNSSLGAATYRFLTVAIGNKSPLLRVRQYFSASLVMHICIGMVIVFLSETVGLWWIHNHLNVTPDRLEPAMIAYHLFVLQSFFVITNAPYQSIYEAYERFDIGAVLGLLEVLLRFGAVLILDLFPYDKLETYAFLLFLVALLMTLLRKGYAHYLFKESHFIWVKDKTIYKEMLSFSSLTFLPNIVSAVCGEGQNLLINSFFGPVANAAKGIAQQVQGALWSFVGNMQAPAGPAIVKYYAEGNYEEMRKLMHRIAKFSVFLFFMLSLPIVFEMNNILHFWLKGNVPTYTTSFLLVILLQSLFNTFMNPSATPINASGQIKKISVVAAALQPVSLLGVYVAYYIGCPPVAQVVVGILVSLVAFYVRLLEIKRLFGYRPYEYVRYTFLSTIPAMLFSAVLPAIIVHFFEPTVYRLFINSGLTVLLTAGVIYTIGLQADEKNFVKKMALQLWNKYFSKSNA